MDPLHQWLIPYAYNITGSYQDAKDIVQDVMLEKLNRQGTVIENEKAYLVRSVINRAITAKNRQKKIAASYPGVWLPEPVATEGADHPLHRKDILSYSLLVLMEKLDPRERAVFILKEAFDYSHEEIAHFLEISVENSRKILSRAKKQVRGDNLHRASPLPPGYLQQYIDIIHDGDTQRLEKLLCQDIVLSSDGGGKAVAALNPLLGKETTLLFLSGIYRKFYQDAVIEEGFVNHQPALFFYEKGRVATCQVFEMEGGLIRRFYFMRNPDKLTALAPSGQERFTGMDR